MAKDDPDPVVRAIQDLHRTVTSGQKEDERLFNQLIENISQLSSLLGGEKSVREDNRRNANAYQKFKQKVGDESEKLGQKRYEFLYGYKRDKKTGEIITDRDKIGFARREVSDLNLPATFEALSEGQLERAGTMFVTGLARSAYARPFLVPSGLRGSARALDFARNRTIAQKLGQPNAMGMSAGLAGPGAEGFQSGLGSFVSSLTAFPSMFASKTGEPFSLFGGSLAPAIAEGYQNRKEAFMQSINPFSMIGYQQNLQILEAVGAKGFKGTSERFQVSDVVRDLIQTIGIETNTAIDMLDVAIKQLHIDVNEAGDQMKLFGTMSRGAGKGVAQFAQETFDVMRQLANQGGQGRGTMMSAALMSSVPQVSGSVVQNTLFNNPLIQGFTLSNMVNQGASQKDLLLQSMGFGAAIGGGENTLSMTAQNAVSLRNFVDMAKSSLGEEVAIGVAARQFGIEYREAKQMYKNAPNLIRQSEAMSEINKFKTTALRSKNLLMESQMGRPGAPKLKGEAKKAYEIFTSGFKAQAAYAAKNDGNIPFLGFGDNISFQDPSGEDDQKFTLNVRRLVAAKRFGKEDPTEVINELRDSGEDVAAIERAADLFIAAGRTGNTAESRRRSQSAFVKLSQDFNVTGSTGPFSGFSSEKLREMTPEKWKNFTGKGEYISQGMKVIDVAREKGLLKENQYKKYEQQIRAGKFDFDKFQKTILGAGADEATAKNRYTIDLSPETKNFFTGILGPGKPGSKNYNP